MNSVRYFITVSISALIVQWRLSRAMILGCFRTRSNFNNRIHLANRKTDALPLICMNSHGKTDRISKIIQLLR